jgi:hypothetical protein
VSIAGGAGQRMLLPFLVIYGLPSAAPYLIRRFSRTPNVAVVAPGKIVVAVVVAGTALSVILPVVAMRLFEREKLGLS